MEGFRLPFLTVDLLRCNVQKFTFENRDLWHQSLLLLLLCSSILLLLFLLLIIIIVFFIWRELVFFVIIIGGKWYTSVFNSILSRSCHNTYQCFRICHCSQFNYVNRISRRNSVLRLFDLAVIIIISHFMFSKYFITVLHIVVISS